MRKSITAICVTLIIALNILLLASLFFAPTNGLEPNVALKWTNDTDAFVEETFGHYKTDLEKVTAIHDWIIANIEYTPYNLPLIQTVDVDATIASGEGICYEQASLFTVFCRISGIECYNVDGRAKNNFATTHSWNRFCIDGQWYEVDITHDQTAIQKNLTLYGIKKIDGLDAPDKTYNIYRTY